MGRARAAWATAVDRVAALPAGTADLSVDGEWSFAQTLRHLVFATDVWLSRTILRRPEPLHPLGQPHAEYETDGYDMSVFATGRPSLAEVLDLRAERQTTMRDFLASVTPELLAESRSHPWSPDHEATVLRCLHVIFHEEWEHLRFALRDLDALVHP
ncbi:DinB family protein [Micromonospora sp. NPDC049366]|uniref:DinB family protein n=1 Tax=Micromonospora sp. NPDC049366 TaxID=3364271 RepID=UPI0037A16F8E